MIRSRKVNPREKLKLIRKIVQKTEKEVEEIMSMPSIPPVTQTDVANASVRQAYEQIRKIVLPQMAAR